MSASASAAGSASTGSSSSSARAQTWYEVLGVPPTASDAEIQHAYRSLAIQFHPDRQHHQQQHQQHQQHQQQHRSHDPSHFALIVKAYEELHSPVFRALYDLEIGVTRDTDEERSRIHRLRRAEAMQALRHMTEKVHRIKLLEEQCDGLVIVSASYGDLRTADATRRGTRVDVTLQLQALVHSSMLIVREGLSKSWLEGFHDPTEGGDNRLHVVYKFASRLHHVTVDDVEELAIPKEEHLMTEEDIAAWEKTFAVRSLPMANIKRQRRFMLLMCTLLGVGAFAWYRGYLHVPRFLLDWIHHAASPTSSSSASSSSSTSSRTSSAPATANANASTAATTPSTPSSTTAPTPSRFVSSPLEPTALTLLLSALAAPGAPLLLSPSRSPRFHSS